MRLGTGAGETLAHPVGATVDPSALAQLAAREQPRPVQAGREVAPWLLGWLELHQHNPVVLEVVRARDEFGRRKYGQPLTTMDGRIGAADLVQELADALMYAAKERMLGRSPSAEALLLLDSLRRLMCPPRTRSVSTTEQHVAAIQALADRVGFLTIRLAQLETGFTRQVAERLVADEAARRGWGERRGANNTRVWKAG